MSSLVRSEEYDGRLDILVLGETVEEPQPTTAPTFWRFVAEKVGAARCETYAPGEYALMAVNVVVAGVVDEVDGVQDGTAP